MKIMIDTNVIIDLLLKREPFALSAKKIIDLIENKVFKGCLSPTSITTIHYLIQKAHNKEKADYLICKIVKNFEVLDIDKGIFLSCCGRDFKDFEDEVIIALAQKFKMNYIITRNKKDFLHSNIKVLTPNEFIDLVEYE